MSLGLYSFAHDGVRARSLYCAFTGTDFHVEYGDGSSRELTPDRIFKELIWPLDEQDFQLKSLSNIEPPPIGVTILVLNGVVPFMSVNCQRERGLWVDKSNPLEPEMTDAVSARSDILSALSVLIEEYEPPCEVNDDAA